MLTQLQLLKLAHVAYQGHELEVLGVKLYFLLLILLSMKRQVVCLDLLLKLLSLLTLKL